MKIQNCLLSLCECITSISFCVTSVNLYHVAYSDIFCLVARVFGKVAVILLLNRQNDTSVILL